MSHWLLDTLSDARLDALMQVASSPDEACGIRGVGEMTMAHLAIAKRRGKLAFGRWDRSGFAITRNGIDAVVPGFRCAPSGLLAPTSCRLIAIYLPCPIAELPGRVVKGPS